MRSWIHVRLFLMLTLLVAALGFAQIASADDIDIRGINFKRSQPVEGDRLVDVVAEPSADSMAVLQQAANILNAYPKLRVKIVGFTDDKECAGSDCIQLSFRRAKYVKDWFLTHGVSIQQLYGPEGHGSADPIGENATERGRSYNRRTELQVVAY